MSLNSIISSLTLKNVVLENDSIVNIRGNNLKMKIFYVQYYLFSGYRNVAQN